MPVIFRASSAMITVDPANVTALPADEASWIRLHAQLLRRDVKLELLTNAYWERTLRGLASQVSGEPVPEAPLARLNASGGVGPFGRFRNAGDSGEACVARGNDSESDNQRFDAQQVGAEESQNRND